MDAATEHVHDHIVNVEPAYDALMEACRGWEADQSGPIAPYCDQMRDFMERFVESDKRDIGLSSADLEDVDYASMIQWELENG
jgi:hypothetical protein